MRNSPGWAILMNHLEDEAVAAHDRLLEIEPHDVEEMAAAQMKAKRARWYRDSVDLLLTTILEPETAGQPPEEMTPGEPLPEEIE